MSERRWQGEGEVSLEAIRAFVDQVARDLDPQTRYVRELRVVLDAASDVEDYLRRLADAERVRTFQQDGSQVSHGERGRSWVDDETWGEMDPFERTLSNLLTGETRMMWAGEGQQDFLHFPLALVSHGEEPLRVLSVPCSTGKEVFSLTIAGLLAGLDVQVTGVDRQAAYLERARSGVLVAHQRDWEHRRAGEFLERREGRTHVRPQVLARTTFVQGDVLVPDLPEGPFHVVSCRNLLGYFRDDVLATAWRNVASRVAPGGLLLHDPFVSGGEEMARVRELLAEQGFERVCAGASWYRGRS